MRETEKIVFHDRDVTVIGRVFVNARRTGAPMVVAILLMVLALAARGVLAIAAFGVALFSVQRYSMSVATASALMLAIRTIRVAGASLVSPVWGNLALNLRRARRADGAATGERA